MGTTPSSAYGDDLWMQTELLELAVNTLTQGLLVVTVIFLERKLTNGLLMVHR